MDPVLVGSPPVATVVDMIMMVAMISLISMLRLLATCGATDYRLGPPTR